MARALTAVLLALLVVLAGCGGAGGGGGGIDGGDADSGDSAEGGDGANGDSGPAAPDDRAATDGDDAASERVGRPTATRIRNGRITVEVDAYDDARANLTRTARDLGGYVSGGQRRTHRDGNRTWTNGTVEVRVPNENFTRMMDAARAAGTVRTSATNSTDVADRLVNVEGRLENLRSKRDRLRELYDGASRTEELLSIQDRISETQGEIERLTARQAALEDRVAYATITIHIEEPTPPAPERAAENESTASNATAWHDAGPVDAFTTSVDTIVTAVRIGGVAFAYALPYLFALGVPAAAVVGVRRRRRRARR